jgi:hypothetical protein
MPAHPKWNAQKSTLAISLASSYYIRGRALEQREPRHRIEN